MAFFRKKKKLSRTAKQALAIRSGFIPPKRPQTGGNIGGRKPRRPQSAKDAANSGIIAFARGQGDKAAAAIAAAANMPLGARIGDTDYIQLPSPSNPALGEKPFTGGASRSEIVGVKNTSNLKGRHYKTYFKAGFKPTKSVIANSKHNGVSKNNYLDTNVAVYSSPQQRKSLTMRTGFKPSLKVSFIMSSF